MSETASVASSAAAKPRQLRRRREIMDAAAAVFAKKGYHAATTRDLRQPTRPKVTLGEAPCARWDFFHSARRPKHFYEPFRPVTPAAWRM